MDGLRKKEGKKHLASPGCYKRREFWFFCGTAGTSSGAGAEILSPAAEEGGCL